MAAYHPPLKSFSAIFDSPEVERRPMRQALRVALLVITASRETKTASSAAGQARRLVKIRVTSAQCAIRDAVFECSTESAFHIAACHWF